MVTRSAFLRMFDLRHVGVCPTCIRTSFVATVLSWLLVLSTFLLQLHATTLIIIAASSFTLLWLAHIFTRAIRFPNQTEQPRDASKRRVFGTIAKAALAAAMMSATVFPRTARADSGCGGWAGNSGCNPCVNNCFRQDVNCNCYACHSCCQGGGNC